MKCLVCDCECDKRLTLDIDMRGLGFCNKHEQDVKMFMYLLLMDEGEDMANKWLKDCQKKAKQKQK